MRKGAQDIYRGGQGRSYSRGITAHVKEAAGKESPRRVHRRPMITMRGPTLSSLDGEVELLREK